MLIGIKLICATGFGTKILFTCIIQQGMLFFNTRIITTKLFCMQNVMYLVLLHFWRQSTFSIKLLMTDFKIIPRAG